MPIISYVDYLVFFSDPGEHALAMAKTGGRGLMEIAPYQAAAFFGVTWPPPALPMEEQDKGMAHSPYGFPSVPGPGYHLPWTYDPNVYIKSDEPYAVLPDYEPAYLGMPRQHVASHEFDQHLTWMAIIHKINAPTEGTPNVDVATIPPRRWIGGMELTTRGEGGATYSAERGNRVSTRVIDGHGMSIRGNMTTTPWNRTVNALRPGLVTNKSWERFYVRVVTSPLIPCGIWKCNGTPAFSEGGALKIGVGPSLELYNIEPGLIATLKGSVPLVLGKWYLIDILLYVDTGVDTEASIRVFLNHEPVLSYVESAGVGINALTSHLDSSLGKWTLEVDPDVEIDLDDWICADVPLIDGIEVLNNVDWLVGSHVRPVNSVSLVATSWAGGNVGTLNHGISSFNNLSANYTSSTSGATITGLTDATEGIEDITGVNYGAVAAEVSQESSNSTGTDGRLGYKVAGGAAVTTVVDQTPGLDHQTVGYFPSGNAVPQPISPFSVVKTKSTNAALDATTMLQAVIEFIGIWGTEDEPTTFDYDRTNYLHNCRYPTTFFANLATPPLGLVYNVGGTYVGNGTYQEILLPLECHFLWIRPTTGAVTGGITFFASSMAAHFGGRTRTIPNVRVFSNTLGLIKFSVDGTSLAVNQSGITYQYVAFCDPGMRFNLCGAYSFYNNGIERPIQLIDNTFTPEAAFIQIDDYVVTSNVIGLGYKGQGYSGATGQYVDGTAIPDFGYFAQGQFITQPGIQSQATQVNYSLWRCQDHCEGTMVQICSYVGDGVSPRNVAVTPLCGRWPLFAMIQPHDGEAYFRDPSHTGSSSCTVNSLVASSAAIIGGGIDLLQVGATLNSIGITYDIFVIPGGPDGWANGVFYPGNCSLGPQFLPPPEPPLPGINVLAEGGLMFNGTTSQLLMKDISGIYTLIPDKRNDTYIDRQPAQTEIQVRIPEPNFKTGFIGG